MKKEVGLIVLAVALLAIAAFHSTNSGLQLSPDSFGKNTLSQRCFDALEQFDGADIESVSRSCEGLGAAKAHAYAAENGLSSSGACSVNPRADVNGDGNIGFADVLAVLANWGPCSDCVEDVNEDGTVGFADILIILADWHKPICQCIDSSDNDDDGLSDAFDPGCWANPSDEETYDAMIDDESLFTSECQDGIDNDNDTFVDWPADPECASSQGYSEGDGPISGVCGDGICGASEDEWSCTEDCWFFENVCGNGIIEEEVGEECDDGSFFDFDGCDKECKLERGPNWICEGEPTNCALEGWKPFEGEQRLAVIMVHETGDNPTKTREEAYEDILGPSNPYSFNGFFEENSYNKIDITGDVYGWYELETYDVNELVYAADEDINYSQVDRLLSIRYINDPESGCRGGIGGASLVPYNTDEGRRYVVPTRYSANDLPECQQWFDFSFEHVIHNSDIYQVMAHEMGHSYRMKHAGGLDCGSEVYTKDGIGCESVRLIDNTDIMSASSSGHFNPVAKEGLGWIDEPLMTEVFESGIYTIDAYEEPGNVLLKVPRTTCAYTADENDLCAGDGIGWYYLTIRRNVGYDQELFNDGVENLDGIFFHIDGLSLESWNGGLILDMSPEEISSEVLEPGMSWQEPHQGITFTTLSIDETSATVQIDFPDGNCGDGVIGGVDQCDDGNTEDGDGCSSICLIEGGFICTGEPSICEEKDVSRVFLTSETHTGDFDGALENADAFCQQLAETSTAYPDLGESEWVAWLSNDTVNAKDRMANPATFALLNDTIVSYEYEELLDGNILSPISLDENDIAHSGFVPVWTGTNIDGTSHHLNCADWTSGTSSNGESGLGVIGDYRWTEWNFKRCNNEHHVYCFEQV